MPKFPDGVDSDKSFEVSAKTLGRTLQRWFPRSHVLVRQAWTKESIFGELEKAKKPIRQVHLLVHGTATWLSLAYWYDGGKRALARARKYNTIKGKSSRQRALMAWAEEDAIVAGYFTHAMDKTRLARLRSKHDENATWQIWGCFAGEVSGALGDDSNPEKDAYFKRFGLGKTTVPGIGSEIAKAFGRQCTAAQGENGLEFWHRDKKTRKLAKNRGSAPFTPPVLPFWLWLTKGQTWATYGTDGKLLKDAHLFQKRRAATELTKPEPPKWLVDGYG